MDASHFPVILTYHSISEGNSCLQVAPALFAGQMEWLGQNVRVAPLSEVISALTEHRPLPERTVALTFDDGFRDFYNDAAPVLRRLMLPATIFLPTGLCGGSNNWTGQDASWANQHALLDWQQVGELAQQGFEFGAHSVSHPVLSELPPEQANYEIAGSKSTLCEHTGQAVKFFAYPFGRWNPAIRSIVQQHYRGACSTGAGVVQPDADPYALPRVDVHYLRRPALFRKLFTASFVTYVAARRSIRRMRRQPEGHYARLSMRGAT